MYTLFTSGYNEIKIQFTYNMFAEMLHSAMRCLSVTPHENTELLVNPGPTRIQIGHMTQYYIIKYNIHLELQLINEHHCDKYMWIKTIYSDKWLKLSAISNTLINNNKWYVV